MARPRTAYSWGWATRSEHTPFAQGMDPRPVRMALPSTPCVDAPSGQRAAQRVGRRAKRASRPAPDERKRVPFGSPLLFPQRQGSHQCRIHARNHLEKQAPLLRGCPDRGGERQAKGGARALRRNVWGDVRNARRVPRQIRKGLPFGSPFLLSGGEGGSLSHITPKTLAAQDLAPEAPTQSVQGSAHDITAIPTPQRKIRAFGLYNCIAPR